MTLEIAAGWTEPLDFQLLDDGAPFVIPGGAAITLTLKNSGGTDVTLTGSVAVTDAGAGKVRYSPGDSDLQEGLYKARFRVEVNGDEAFFPSGARDSWRVHP